MEVSILEGREENTIDVTINMYARDESEDSAEGDGVGSTSYGGFVYERRKTMEIKADEQRKGKKKS